MKLRPLEKRHVPSGCKLLNDYLNKFEFRQVCKYVMFLRRKVFDEHEFEHWFITRDGIINSWVIEVLLVQFSCLHRNLIQVK